MHMQEQASCRLAVLRLQAGHCLLAHPPRPAVRATMRPASSSFAAATPASRPHRQRMSCQKAA